MIVTKNPDVRAAEPTAPRRAAILIGGACWVLAIVQYAAAQLVAAAAWSRPYSVRDNYISDLGNTACGMFHVPHGTPYYVCSPQHALMNASFICGGVLAIVGALLLRRLLPGGRSMRWALALWIISGLGKVVVGLVPENTDIGLHLLGALNVPVTSVAILLVSLRLRRPGPALAAVGIAIAVTGLVGSFLSTAGQYAGPALYLGLGVGGAERLASYPGSIWILLAGILALSTATRPFSARRSGR